jgi:hypothetical protein
VLQDLQDHQEEDVVVDFVEEVVSEEFSEAEEGDAEEEEELRFLSEEEAVEEEDAEEESKFLEEDQDSSSREPVTGSTAWREFVLKDTFSGAEKLRQLDASLTTTPMVTEDVLVGPTDSQEVEEELEESASNTLNSMEFHFVWDTRSETESVSALIRKLRTQLQPAQGIRCSEGEESAATSRFSHLLKFALSLLTPVEIAVREEEDGIRESEEEEED